MIARVLLVMLALCASGAVSAADSGIIAANSSLYKQPDGVLAGTLLANTLVEIIERRGGWYQVSASGGRQGWVRLGAVKLSGQQQSDSVFSGLWGWLNSSDSVQSGGTATAGIRGLDAGDIEAAAADHAAVDSLDRFAIDAPTARRYAAALPLSARQVADLQERKK